jgi:thioester reductase-like protein
MRLKNLLMYYFESPGIMLFGKRIIVLEGDITDREKLMSYTGLPIHTVINCAASVKHFAADSGIEDINFGGTKNVIDFCLSSGAAMIQTSTMSVIEIGYKDSKATVPNEQTLHFGQDLTNKYVRSKFLAERAVLEAVVRKGLRAKIMRYGNLSARFSDGEFQINFESNNAMGSLRAYATLGCAAYDQLNGTMEFSPIDMVAQATVKLAKTPAECTLFHVLSDQYLQMVHVFNEMNAMGHTIRYTERDEYERAFAEAMNDPEAAPHLTSLIAYTMNAGERERQILTMDQKYTLQVLYRLGFVWPINSWDYFRRFMGVLDGLGYFDKSFED